MTNKLTSAPPDQAILSRLTVLLQSVNDSYQNDISITDDELSDIYHESMQLFFDSLDGSITGVTYPIIPGAPPDPIDYNVFTTAILRDLQAMFLEAGSVDRLVSSNFNTIVALREQLLSISRRISLKTGDYLLYADPKLGNGFFFGDTFNSSTYLDINSDLLEGDECYLSQEEGVVTLPLDETPVRAVFSKIIINSNSNGTNGNNHQLNALPHDDLKAVGDGEPDTWYEYERVSNNAASEPLVLDMTIVLNDTSIVNHIHIDPVFFGTPTPVRITKLETSLDGKEYRSIKDEVPVSDFFSETEDDIFVLSGKSSKYYGIAKFSFLPRRTKFIRIVLEQHDPYAIDSTSGTLLRYAIGLKDINIYSRKFKPEGSIISTPIQINGDTTKLSMWSSENPIEESSLANINHEVSVDDGSSWIAIQPQNRDEVVYPEILNFNNAESNSITTETEVNNIRHKIIMKREPDAFQGEIVLKSERLSKIDVVSIPGFSPFNVSLQEEPIPDTVSVYLPILGSVSCPISSRNSAVRSSPPMDLDFVQFNIDNDSTGSVRFKLPWTDIPELQHHIRVFVNGEQWEYRSKSSGDLSALDENSKVYFLNKNGREIQFSYDINNIQKGMLPGSGARIQVCLDGDNPPMVRSDAGYTLQLMGSSDGFKKNVSIATPLQLYSEEVTNVNEWQSNTTYAIGEFVRSSNGQDYKCSKSGNSGSTEPEWNTDYESYTADNTCIWVRKNSAGAVNGDWEKIPLSSFKKSFNIYDYLSLQDQGTKDKDTSFMTIGSGKDKSSVSQTENSGMALPTFGVEYEMLEYAPGSSVPLDLTKAEDIEKSYNMEEVSYIDGHAEFYDGDADDSNNWKNQRWSFDQENGILHFSNVVFNNRYKNRFVFKARRTKLKVLNESNWDFYKDPVTNKVDTSKIVLDPNAVRQFPVTVSALPEATAIALVGQNDLTESTPENSITSLDNIPGHNWFKKRIVKGSIKLSTDLIDTGIVPIEVPYVDGRTELLNAVNVQYKIIARDPSSSNIVTVTIPNITSDRPLIDDPVFESIIIYPDPVQPSQFAKRVSTETEVDDKAGNYFINNETGIIKVNIPLGSSLRAHTVKYAYEDGTNGVDKKSLFSVDYNNGFVYFGKNDGIAGGTIAYSVTMYSAFYNMGEIVSDGNIQEINASAKTIEMRPEYGIRFLADESSGNPVPKYLRVSYEYNKTVTESLKDLEPYFSPICKDIAIRAITKDMIGDI